MTQVEIEATPQINDDYVSEFPELESRIHVMIEKIHEELPLAIDKLVAAYDELVSELRSKPGETKS